MSIRIYPRNKILLLGTGAAHFWTFHQLASHCLSNNMLKITQIHKHLDVQPQILLQFKHWIIIRPITQAWPREMIFPNSNFSAFLHSANYSYIVHTTTVWTQVHYERLLRLSYHSTIEILATRLKELCVSMSTTLNA